MTNYFRKPDALVDAVKAVLSGQPVQEKMDPVDQKALKGKHSDRKDKDIDNDGDVDSSDEYLHKRRKAVSKAMKEGVEDNPANTQHLCAKNVVHESWGEGSCIPTMHADPDEEGNVAWYDVMFDHGIEEQVSIEELKVTKAESHMHSSKKKIKESKDEDDDDDDSDEDEKNGKKKKVSGKKDDVDVEPEMDDTKMVNEKEMTPAQEKKREEIVTSMKKKMPDFKKKYGDRAKDVMYATATKMAMKEGFELGIEKSDLIEEVELDEAKIEKWVFGNAQVYKVPAKDGGHFVVLHRDTSGMRGTQDKFHMRHLKNGKVKDYGTHSSLDGALKFAKNRGIIEEVELDEAKLSASQIAALKKAYEPMRGKKMSMDSGNKLRSIIDKVDDDKEALSQLVKADIPFVSQLAITRLITNHGMKGAEIRKMQEEVELDEAKVTKKERDRLEDQNEHGLLALKLAKAYGTPAEVKKIEAINKKHQKDGSIERKDQQERDSISNKYYKMAEETELDEGRGRPRKDGTKSDTDDREQIQMQLRKSVSLRGLKDVEFDDGKKVKVSARDARDVLGKLDAIKAPRERQNAVVHIAKSHKNLVDFAKGKAGEMDPEQRRKDAANSPFKKK
jgi:hypothetical protein